MQIEHINNRLDLSVHERIKSPQRTLVSSIPQKSDQIDLTLPKSVVDAQADVRMDRIEVVRERMMNGFYDRTEVREEIAGSFLKAQIA